MNPTSDTTDRAKRRSLPSADSAPGPSDESPGRLTIGVLPGWAVYERAIIQNFLGPVLHGIRRAALEWECNLLLACGIVLPGGQVGVNYPAWPVFSPETDFVPVGPWNTDGLIVVNPLLSETKTRYIHDLAQAGHPIVYIGTAQQGIPTIALDNDGGIHRAVAHLVEHGHRRIAFIAGSPDDSQGDSGERLQAYRASVKEYDLEPDPDLIVYGHHIVEGGQAAMRQLFDSRVSFTAVLASSDECAIGAMQVLQEQGLRVPHDIAVIGFDDQLEAMIQTPPLTAVHSPTFERGYRALELLLKRIEQQEGSEKVIKVPTRLVIRRSCGCSSHPETRAASNAPAQPISCTDLHSVTSQMSHAMAEAVLTVARRLTSDAIHTLCKRLAEAFVADLERAGATDFPSTLEQVLRQVKDTGDDAHMWQAALSVLREKVPALLEKCDAPITRQQAEDKLHQARTAISEAMEYQARQHVHDQRWAADRLALLTARLLTARDETQISEVLGELLPGVGIQHAGVAFFEADGDDPTAWSILHATPNLTTTTFRFASQQFPPKGLYPEDKPFSLALLPLVIQGEKAGFVALDTGNLELCGAIVQQLADALLSARLYREATEGRRLAEEANRMKSRFLSTVSHELRTPLNVIAGLSKLVLSEEKRAGPLSPETYRQDLERILSSAEHLDGLIQDVLDLARSEVGQLKLTCEPLNLAGVLEVAIAAGEQLARDKGLSWRAEVPQDLPQVWGDRTRLRQVALNLINNAVKFTAQGKVVLCVEVKEDMVTVAVSDTGLGIPAGEQKVIFDEFRQSERTTARGYGGLGLGLAICKRLVELHDGTIGVQSSGEEGTGATFYFTLPIINGSPGADVSTQTQSQKVLLISEHLGSGGQLREHLSRQGFKVEEVGTDETADWLTQLLASPPGAVLLDKALASEQGWQVLKMLKGNPATHDIPVMFYALSQVQDSGSVLELDYLAKPVGTAELARALKRQGLTSNGDDEKRILIVDDEPSILDMHARIVQAQSATYRVLKARNGREALALMRREQPHLVLLDLMMPEMDGFAVLEALQQEGETVRNTPVIVLTSQVLTENDMNRLKGGVSAVLRKGLFSVEETLMHLEQALSQRRKLGSDMQRLVRKAMAYIHERYMETISRADIAEYVGISSDHLTRSFRQETGLTPVAYLNRYRVNQAKTLLRESDRTITEIAGAVGFSDSNYFSRVFRQEVGTSPSTYRRTQRK